jgi:hypothetical protein
MSNETSQSQSSGSLSTNVHLCPPLFPFCGNNTALEATDLVVRDLHSISPKQLWAFNTCHPSRQITLPATTRPSRRAHPHDHDHSTKEESQSYCSIQHIGALFRYALCSMGSADRKHGPHSEKGDAKAIARRLCGDSL